MKNKLKQTKNPVEKTKEYRKNKNNPDKLFELANKYRINDKLNGINSTSLRYYQRAEELGHGKSCYILGMNTLKNSVDPLHKSTGASYHFLKGAKANDPDCTYMLAEYKMSVGKFEEANELYQKAYELGNTDGLFGYARNIELGKGIEKNLDKAIELYEKAIKENNTNSMISLGLIYHKDNPKKAYRLIKKSADLDNPNGNLIVSKFYYDGVGIKKNITKAFQYMKKAAELDVPEAMYLLGLYYTKGEGIEKNLDEGFRWIKNASFKNHLEARKWIVNQADKGHKGAIDHLNFINNLRTY